MRLTHSSTFILSYALNSIDKLIIHFIESDVIAKTHNLKTNLVKSLSIPRNFKCELWNATEAYISVRNQTNLPKIWNL